MLNCNFGDCLPKLFVCLFQQCLLVMDISCWLQQLCFSL